MHSNLLKQDFSSPFSSRYWKKAIENVSNIRIIVLTAFFIAMYCLFNMTFRIKVSENLNIMINYIPSSLCGMVGGPFVSLIYGFISDIIGFFLRPEYGFFPGYTISTMATSFIFSLFLFGAKHNFFLYIRIAISKICVNIFINIFLNCLWSQILFGKGYFYYLATSIVKNIILLPVEIIIMCAVIVPVFVIFRIKYTPIRNKA